MPIIIPDDLPYTAPGIECLRFGARRGGTGIGCCAVDVFQGFKNAPDAHCPPIPFFDGDSWTPLEYGDGQLALTGTNADVFRAYLTHGSFTNDPAPDHAFIAILTDSQCESEVGKQWLTILREEGFKWVGATSNSVYCEYHPNHIFLLVRSTREYMDDEEIAWLAEPPAFWGSLPAPTQTPEERFKIHCRNYTQCHTSVPYKSFEDA